MSMKKRLEIQLNEIVLNRDIKHGNLILLTGKPCLGEIFTCSQIIKMYEKEYKYLYLTLIGKESKWTKDISADNDFYSSVEIIKKIQKEIKVNNIKFVFIDNWRLIEDKSKWFCDTLMSLALEYQLVIFVCAIIPSFPQKKSWCPTMKQLKKTDIYQKAWKVINVYRLSHSEKAVNDIKFGYVLYKYDNEEKKKMIFWHLNNDKNVC